MSNKEAKNRAILEKSRNMTARFKKAFEVFFILMVGIMFSVLAYIGLLYAYSIYFAVLP